MQHSGRRKPPAGGAARQAKSLDQAGRKDHGGSLDQHLPSLRNLRKANEQ
jgi:hypothetical protein